MVPAGGASRNAWRRGKIAGAMDPLLYRRLVRASSIFLLVVVLGSAVPVWTVWHLSYSAVALDGPLWEALAGVPSTIAQVGFSTKLLTDYYRHDLIVAATIFAAGLAAGGAAFWCNRRGPRRPAK
jgi:hypothetical protein